MLHFSTVLLVHVSFPLCVCNKFTTDDTCSHLSYYNVYSVTVPRPHTAFRAYTCTRSKPPLACWWSYDLHVITTISYRLSAWLKWRAQIFLPNETAPMLTGTQMTFEVVLKLRREPQLNFFWSEVRFPSLSSRPPRMMMPHPQSPVGWPHPLCWPQCTIQCVWWRWAAVKLRWRHPASTWLSATH